MEFDYQTIKDGEKRRREEALRGIHRSAPPNTCNTQSLHQHPPPLKPRRSVRSRPLLQERSTSFTLPLGAPMSLEPLSASLRAHTMLWFETSQLPRLKRPGCALPSWLHGFATRREAEELLKDKQQGCFLLRLSESKIGFVLSYRGKDRCRHFIIEEEGEGEDASHYIIVGEESRHSSLQDLVTYYSQHPVGPFDEMLTVPFVKGTRGGTDVPSQGPDTCGELKDSAAAPNLSYTPNGPESCAAAASVTAQYAVVKKPLKKSLSLPGPQLVADRGGPLCMETPQPPGLQPGQDSAGAVAVVDPPYARVNKPPRGSSKPHSSLPTPPARGHQEEHEARPLSHGASGSDQKYWEMVPLHTYEETGHLVPSVNSSNHVYSEINPRSREVSGPTPGRVAPSVPQRPPPRAIDGQSQRSNGFLSPRSRVHTPPNPDRPLPTPPTSIYEQIPERRIAP